MPPLSICIMRKEMVRERRATYAHFLPPKSWFRCYSSFPEKAPLVFGRWWEFRDDEGCRSGAPFTWTKSSGGLHPRSLLLSNFVNAGANFHGFFQFPPLCWPHFWTSLFRISFAISSPYCVLLPAFCMGAFWSVFCFQFKCHSSESLSHNHRNYLLSFLFLVHHPMLIFSLHCPVRATRPLGPSTRL